MINGRTLEEEKKRVANLLEQQSIEEFEDMLVRNGIYQILPSDQSSYNKVYLDSIEE